MSRQEDHGQECSKDICLARPSAGDECASCRRRRHGAGPVSVLVEAEAFGNRGGWVVDPQFMDVMGSPYLLAHGLGRPVPDAVTTVELPGPGSVPGVGADEGLGGDMESSRGAGTVSVAHQWPAARRHVRHGRRRVALAGGRYRADREPARHAGAARPDRLRGTLRRHSVYDG